MANKKEEKSNNTSEKETKNIKSSKSKEKPTKAENLENKTKKNNHKKINKITVIIIPIIFLIIISVIFALMNITNENILNNISIMGIDVSDLSKEEAKTVLNDIINKKINEEIILKKDDYETSITPNQINANFNIENAINEAYNIGKDGNIIANNYNILFTMLFGRNIDCDLQYNTESMDKKISDISAKLPNSVKQSSYYIEGNNLIIVKGKQGVEIKNPDLEEKIINEIKDINNNSEIIQIPTQDAVPTEINLEKIRNEIYKEAESAYISQNPTTVHPSVDGVDFAISLEEAEKILSEEKEEYTIPLKITKPEKTLTDLGEEAFPDKIATYSTRYDPSNLNRSNNLSISAKKIDGTILLPGETFSYNQTVGERTIAEGYKEAGAYAGGRVVQDVGGGICQTSSTLYNAALLANLEIVDRSNHQFLTSYVSAGRDATVSWGTIDFQFKNNRTYPIKIEASAKNGVCLMSIYGIKEETEYEVVIQSDVISYIPYKTIYENDSSLEEGKEVVEQSGYKGCKSETYKILKLNGKTVSKTLLSKDTYDAMDRIIKRGTKNETEINATEENSKNEIQKENDIEE